MTITKPKKATITVIMAAFILLAVAGLSIPPTFAGSGSIARVNFYPQDQITYESVNHFLYQTTAVNTNTTVSVSIDGKPPIPLTCQDLKSETIPGDTAPTDWYTWQTTVPAITASGTHTFQFFSHYYVWQETDKHWAEFNAQTEIHSFTIHSNQSDQSASLDPILSTSALPQISVISQGALYAVLASAVAVVVASVTLERRHLARRDQE